jgi:hypothetical protein
MNEWITLFHSFFARWKNFYDYEPYLREHLIKYKPKNILEFGTGKSTKIMKECCPDAEIISFENSRKWYWRWKFSLWGVNTRLAKGEEYTNPILMDGSFDFIFVDGIERTKCMKSSLRLLKDDEFLMLHDCNDYDIPKGYRIIYKKENTALMQKAIRRGEFKF